jgi:sirohydrochlorin ferrochelatase
MTATNSDPALDASFAILIVGHGTRKPEGAQQLRQLVEWMRGIEPDWHFFESFLELAEPSIEHAMERIAAAGLSRVLVVPILLFSAGHAKEDIPQAVADAARERGLEVIGQTPALGTLASVVNLSNIRFEELVRRGPIEGCPAGHCSRAGCASDCELRGAALGRVGLAMIGRGTSDTAALEQMRLLTAKCVASRDVHWYETGFFAGGLPHVDTLLEHAADACNAPSGCDTMILQPHLLFEGELMDQLRHKLRSQRERHPQVQWLLARPLGVDDALARVFVGFIRNAMA